LKPVLGVQVFHHPESPPAGHFRCNDPPPAALARPLSAPIPGTRLRPASGVQVRGIRGRSASSASASGGRRRISSRWTDSGCNEPHPGALWGQWALPGRGRTTPGRAPPRGTRPGSALFFRIRKPASIRVIRVIRGLGVAYGRFGPRGLSTVSGYIREGVPIFDGRFST